MGAAVGRSFRVLGVVLQRFGPYVLLELLLPGGTLFALLLYWYQRRQAIGCAPVATPGVIGRVLDWLRALELAPRTLRLASAPARGCARDGLEPLAMASVRCSCSAGAC